MSEQEFLEWSVAQGMDFGAKTERLYKANMATALLTVLNRPGIRGGCLV